MSAERSPGGPHFEYVVGKLEEAGARYYNGEDWFCPGHDDGNRGSLGISELPNGSIVMYCQGGCENRDLFRLAGLSYPADFYPRKKRERYIYRDENGTPLYCVDRYYKDGKKRLMHRIYAPDHEKADSKGFAAYPKCMNGVPRVLYRLPMLRKAVSSGKPVYICAGEKDAKAMHLAYRVAATTASAGESSKWDASYTEQIRGARRVYVVADRDTAGEKRAAHVYDTLLAEGFDVRILLPAVEGAKADAADHIAEGYGLRDFIPVDRADIASAPDLMEFEFSDTGNAERLVALFGNQVRYIQQHKMWVIWDGRRWATDEPAVTRMAVATLRALGKEIKSALAKAEDEQEIKALYKALNFAVLSENSSRVDGMLKMARSMERISTVPEDYDQDPWLFNVLNGTINLRNGALLPHDRSHMIRKLSAIEYDENAECPLWISFTQRILPVKDVRRLCRKLGGYFLTGDTRESVFPVLYGKGRNGKSTFIETLQEVLGDYGKTLPADTLVRKRGGGQGIPNDVAMLEGARLATAMEFPEGAGIDETLIKALTGNERITARFLNREFFRFKPQAKIVLGTNYKPDIRAADDGLWRRMLLIPFTEYIEDWEVDKELQGKLLLELPGILNWCLDGLADWIRSGGLDVPDVIRGANTDYREESDLMGQFIEDRCVLGEEEWEYSGVLHEAFNLWMEESGARGWTKRAFGMALGERKGIERGRLSGGKSGGQRPRIYAGIRLKNAKDEQQ